MRLLVFLISDETDLCLLMKTFFFRKNYEVANAHSVKDSLAQVKQLQPALIFVSTAVPDYSPDDLLKLREAAPDADIRVDSFQLRMD